VVIKDCNRAEARPHAVFHIVAKDEKDPHIAEDMKPPAVDEHVSKEWEPCQGVEQVDRSRNQPVVENETFQGEGAHGQFQQKDQRVGAN
jgi:hypothetical protein